MAFHTQNHFIEHFIPDPITNNLRRQVNALYSWVEPMPVPQPTLLAINQPLWEALELDALWLENNMANLILSGNITFPHCQSYATCYGGHQFGYWADQLGDGRAINIAQIDSLLGSQVLQLKGAGPTPYSRMGDGKAVLRSSIREFLASEAMHHLGIKTTRALSLTLTGEMIPRDMYYDGNVINEPGAIICRVADNFLRFGHFELLHVRQQYPLLRQLADYTIKYYFSDISNTENIYQCWFQTLCERTLELVTEWIRVGFVHGVMNTDNFSISGLTIDYGPYGWLECYDPYWTPNTSDRQQRYGFSRQINSAIWSLCKLANTLSSLIQDPHWLNTYIQTLPTIAERYLSKMWALKLGLSCPVLTTDTFYQQLMQLLMLSRADYIIFFRELCHFDSDSQQWLDNNMHCFYAELSQTLKIQWLQWLDTYAHKKQQDLLTEIQSHQIMEKSNPKYVLRNFQLYEATQAAELGDLNLFNALWQCIQLPYDEQPQYENFYQKTPDWAMLKRGCSRLSCSS